MNELMALDGGENMWTNSLHVVTTAWLNYSQCSHVAISMNMSARGVNGKAH